MQSFYSFSSVSQTAFATAAYPSYDVEDVSPRTAVNGHVHEAKQPASQVVSEIFLPVGGWRATHAAELDRELKSCECLESLAAVLQDSLIEFDEENIVTALSWAASLIGDDEEAKAAFLGSDRWVALFTEVIQCVEKLEAKGLAMVAQAALDLSWRDDLMLARLARGFASKAKDFTMADLATMCHVFAKLGLTADSRSDFWTAASMEVQARIHSSQPAELAAIARSMSMAKVTSRPVFSALSVAALACLEDFTPLCLARVAWAFANAGIADKPLLDALSAQALEKAATFSASAAGMLCWSLATADAVDFDLFDRLGQHVADNSSALLEGAGPGTSCELAWAFATAQFVHVPLFTAIASAVASWADLFSTEQLARLAWAFASCGQKMRSVFEALAAACSKWEIASAPAADMCLLAWAFATAGFGELDVVPALVEVVVKRISELRGSSGANFFAALELLWPVNSKAPLFLQSALGEVLGVVMSSSLDLDADSLAAVVRLFCHVGLVKDAAILFERVAMDEMSRRAGGRRVVKHGIDASPRLSAYAVLLSAAEETKDWATAAHLWKKLAEETSSSTLRAACHNAAVMVLLRGSSRSLAATLQLRRLAALGLFDAVSQQLAARLGLGDDAQAELAAASEMARELEFKTSSLEVDLHLEENAVQAEMLDAVLEHAALGDGTSVLSALEAYLGDEHDSGGVPAGRAAVLDEEVARRQPACVAELGTSVGYTTLLLAMRLRSGSHSIVTLDRNPYSAAVARNIFEFAGVGDSIQQLVGHADALVGSTKEADAAARMTAFDMVVLRDHSGGHLAPVSHLSKLAGAGLLHSSSVVLADHVLRPGAPLLLGSLKSALDDGADAALVAVDAAAGSDWVSICGCSYVSAADASAACSPSTELAKLAAEAALEWQRLPRWRQGDVGHHDTPGSTIDTCLSARLQAFAKRWSLALPRQRPACALSAKAALERTAEEAATVASSRWESSKLLAAAFQASKASFEAWLHDVSGDDSLHGYADALAERFDSVDQALEAYTFHGTSSQAVDSRLFEDLDVADEAHRASFERCFSERARSAEVMAERCAATERAVNSFAAEKAADDAAKAKSAAAALNESTAAPARQASAAASEDIIYLPSVGTWFQPRRPSLQVLVADRSRYCPDEEAVSNGHHCDDSLPERPVSPGSWERCGPKWTKVHTPRASESLAA
eukprot:TRINITY_DN80147_c0_g1_i1.p1 TRINITY_DN80147_c0_g1~~TRINITY_DN80147_c0_g1_i1.p1  ORF type:complete len:1192 (-),score=322.95 TRINITY_DN80147_c0_g1_i1:148-3723(-)